SILSYLTEFWPINFSREQESVVQSITKNRNCKTAVIYRTARMAQCGDRTRARRYFLASLAARRGGPACCGTRSGPFYFSDSFFRAGPGGPDGRIVKGYALRDAAERAPAGFVPTLEVWRPPDLAIIH